VGSDAEQARQVTELQVVQLRAVATQTEDLEQLKSFIGERLDHLHQHLRKQDTTEGDYQARLEAQLGTLSQQVAALNAETVTLRSRLDVTTEKALRDQLRSSDFVARYGGEEFVVLLNGAGEAAAAHIAEKLRRSIKAAPFRSRGERAPITISCGVGTLTGDDTLEAVFERTDAALYSAKAAGRNRCIHGNSNAA
jgi:predicted signal transduction protein with EAL and GGDEF domain